MAQVHSTGAKSFHYIPLLLTHKYFKLTSRLPNLCNASSERNILIKITHFDQTKDMAHDSKIASAKIKLHVEPQWAQPKKDKMQAPATGRKLLFSAIDESEA